MRWLRLLFTALLVFAAMSCGYSLQPEGSGRFPDPTVRIDLSSFMNDTPETDAGSYIASKLRNELRQRGFGGSFGRIEADFMISGRVRESRDDVLSYAAVRFALENRLTLTVGINVIDIRTGSVLWKDDALRESVSYYSGSDPEYTAANRRAAFEEAVHRITLRMAQTIRLIL
ncbi:MAG: DUF4136 domain-containing protein [Syntrophorhabdaceae bacterium]|nr:DUF4136 domain-containing protein [Syntrophorhabdaceae bacterium]